MTWSENKAGAFSDLFVEYSAVGGGGDILLGKSGVSLFCHSQDYMRSPFSGQNISVSS